MYWENVQIRSNMIGGFVIGTVAGAENVGEKSTKGEGCAIGPW